MSSTTTEKAFERRGIDPEVAIRLGASYQPQHQRYVFDYRSRGKLSFQKFRDEQKKFWIEPAGTKLHLWGLDSIENLSSTQNHHLAITEGEFDRISVVQASGGFAVSVPNGANGRITTEQIKVSDDKAFSYLWSENLRLIHEIEQFDKVILFTDADEPGLILRDELALRIGETRCWFVEIPEGCKDANDILIKLGTKALRSIIAGAKPMRPGYLVRPRDIVNRTAMTYSTGWQSLDRHLMLERPELLIITGVPGHGKTQWMRVLTFRLAEKHGWSIAYLCPEDSTIRLLRDMRNFAERNSRVKYSCSDNADGYEISREDREKATEWMNSRFWISKPPDDETLTMAVVMREMESAALHHGCQVFVIDPWNEIAHDRGSISDTLYIESQLQILKQKARRLGLILIIVAHPTKLAEGQQPSLYSISGSANWKNKADHGIVIWRPDTDSDITTVIVEKCKDWDTMGRPGEVVLEFVRHRSDFIEGSV